MGEKVTKPKDTINRREFLRNSAYAAYATPIVLSMLVEKASAAKSWNSGKGEITKTPAQHWDVGPDPGRGRDEKTGKWD